VFEFGCVELLSLDFIIKFDLRCGVIVSEVREPVYCPFSTLAASENIRGHIETNVTLGMAAERTERA